MESRPADTEGGEVAQVVQDGDHNTVTPSSDNNVVAPTLPDAPPHINHVGEAAQAVPAITPPLTPAVPTQNQNTDPPTPHVTSSGAATVETAVGDHHPTTTSTQPAKDVPVSGESGGRGRYVTAQAGDFVADNYFPGEEHALTAAVQSGQECVEGDLQCDGDHAGEGGHIGVHEAGDDAPTGDPEIEDVVESSGIDDEEDVEVVDTTTTTPSSPHTPSSPSHQPQVDSSSSSPNIAINGGTGETDHPIVPAATPTRTEEHIHAHPSTPDGGEKPPVATTNSTTTTTATPKKRVRTGVRAEKELRGAGNWRYFLTKQATPTSTTTTAHSGGFTEWALDWMDIVVSRTPAGMLHSLCYYQPYQGNAYGAQTQPLIPSLHQILRGGEKDNGILMDTTPYAMGWLWDGVASMVSLAWRRAQFRMCYHIPREVVCQVSSRAVLKPLLGSGQSADPNNHFLLQTLLPTSSSPGSSPTYQSTTDPTTPNNHTIIWSQLADMLPASSNQTNNNNNSTPEMTSPATNELAAKLLKTFHNSVDLGGENRGPFHKFITFDVLPFVDRSALVQMAIGAVLASTNATLRHNISHMEDVATAVGTLLRGTTPAALDSNIGTLHGLTTSSSSGGGVGNSPLGGVYRLIDALIASTMMEGHHGVAPHDVEASPSYSTNFSVFGSQPNISRLCATTKLFSNGTFLYAAQPIGASAQGSIDMEELLRPIFLLSYAASHTVLKMVLEGVAWVLGGIMWAVLWAPFGLLPTLQYLLLRYNYNCTPFRAPIFAEVPPSPVGVDHSDNIEVSMQQHNSTHNASLAGGLETAWVDFLQPFVRPLWEGMGLGTLEVWTCNWELVHEGSTDHSVQESLEGYPVTSALSIVVAVLAFLCFAVYLRYQKYFEAIVTLRERGISRLEEMAAFEREQQEDDLAAGEEADSNSNIGEKEGVDAPMGDQSPPAAQALANVSFPRPSVSPSPQDQHLSPLGIRRVTLKSNGIPCPTPKRSSARIVSTVDDPSQQLHPAAALVDTPPPSQDRPPSVDERELCT